LAFTGSSNTIKGKSKSELENIFKTLTFRTNDNKLLGDCAGIALINKDSSQSLPLFLDIM